MPTCPRRLQSSSKLPRLTRQGQTAQPNVLTTAILLTTVLRQAETGKISEKAHDAAQKHQNTQGRLDWPVASVDEPLQSCSLSQPSALPSPRSTTIYPWIAASTTLRILY